MLLRRAMLENVEVDNVDWDRITFKLRGRYAWPTYRTLEIWQIPSASTGHGQAYL